MDYNQPYGGSTGAPYVNGDPSIGRAGSIPPGAAIEYPQREIVEVIARANARGYTDFTGTACAANSNSDLTQLRKAIEGFAQSDLIDIAVTFTVHGTGANFSDLNAALEYLSKYKITQHGSVILAIAAGKFTYTTPVRVDHPNANKITINGATLLGSVPTRSSFQYTGSSGSQLTADQAAQLTMLRGIFATELYFTSASYFAAWGDVSISNLLLTGDLSTITVPHYGGVTLLNGNPTLNNVSVHGFGSDGVVFNNTRAMMLGTCTSSGNSNSGFEFQGNANATTIIAASNGLHGFNLWSGSLGVGSLLDTQGNHANGIVLGAACSAFSLTTGSQFLNNGGFGISNISGATTFQSATFSGNGSGPVYAFAGANNYLLGSTGLSGSAPAINTVGNSNSYNTG